MNQSPQQGIQPRAAELLARHISTAFINACGYGSDHQMTIRGCQVLHESLLEAFEQEPMISMILDRGSLFIEKQPVGKRFNPFRMINAFNQLELESLTFEAGVSENDIQTLIAILANSEQYPTVDAARQALEERGVYTIRLNYIVFRKLTADQRVVGREEVETEIDESSSIHNSANVSPVAQILSEMDPFISLEDIGREPSRAAKHLSESAGNADDQANRRLVGHLKNLVQEIESGNAAKTTMLPPEELMSAMNTLRFHVKQSIATHLDVDRIMESENEVINEVDQLTYSTLILLVREEYRTGNFSTQRMSQIINRMLPDPDDLKRLLPQLKRALIEEGMSLSEYSKLVHGLSTELRGEHLLRALEQGAESIGLDVEDIVSEMEEDPEEAARLVVLASELRRGGSVDQYQLSAAFTDYIDRITTYFSKEQGGAKKPADPAVIKQQIARVQDHLTSELHKQGLDPKLTDEIDRKLKDKLENLKDDSTVVVAQPGKPSTQLPSGVLSVKDSTFFLEREIRSAQRYKTPFSVIQIIVNQIAPVGSGSPGYSPKPDDFDKLLPQLYFRLLKLVRDLDLVGSLEKERHAVPLLILPMTRQAGADILSRRIDMVLKEFPFELSTGDVSIETEIAAVEYDRESKEVAREFLQRVNPNHGPRPHDLPEPA